jgi:hypothetical protein
MKTFKTREDLLISLGKGLSVAEIGVFKGDFSKFISEYLEPKELFLVDFFEGYVGSGDKDGNNMTYTWLEQEMISLKSYFENHKNTYIIKNTSRDFLNSIEDNKLDLIYIDADHDYKSVREDLELSFNKVKIGGHICGHDYVAPRFEGVVRAVDEFCLEKKLTINYISEDGCPTYCIKKNKVWYV